MHGVADGPDTTAITASNISIFFHPLLDPGGMCSYAP